VGLELQLRGYRRFRANISGNVHVSQDGWLVYADCVTLSSKKSRKAFIRDLKSRLNGNAPDEAELELKLLALLDQADEELNHDPAPGVPGEEEDEIRLDSYAQRDGGYDYIRTNENGGETRIRLSNFVATILEDVTLDDGAERRREFTIAGELEGRQLPTTRISPSAFLGMSWVQEEYGAQARVLPGQKDRLRDAIQTFSHTITTRTVYGHTGWRWVKGRLLYLHSGGAIGSAGSVENVSVELDGELARYLLPEPPIGIELRDAVRASWGLWDVARSEVAATVLGATYGAPLAEWLCPAFTIWLQGMTGRLKTTVAALTLSHFGDFNYTTAPANFESTANALEKQAFLIKDALLLIDDYRPAGDRYEADAMRRKASRIIRAAGNRSGRSRMRTDTRLRDAYYPRGVLVVTGEDCPAGESTGARLWKTAFDEGTVDTSALTKAQRDKTKLGLAMAAFIQFLALKLEGGTSWLLEAYRRSQELGVGLGGHLRQPQSFAYLLTGWVVFAEFAVGTGAVSQEEVARRLTQVLDALQSAGEQQAHDVRELRPEIIFLEVIGDLFAAGEAHLGSVDGGLPDDPTRWGWINVKKDEGEEDRPQGVKLGWVDEGGLHLIPSQAQRLVARTMASRGDHFSVSLQTLRQALRRGGFLRSGNKDQGRRHNVWAEGHARNVLYLDRVAVEGLLAGDEQP
jgi:hypothetical protein